MDEQKKQKVMIAVLAVAILGAGAFFWMNSNSKNQGPDMTAGGPIVRRQVDQSANAGDSGPTRREAPATRRTQEAPTITRRERATNDGSNTITRRRDRSDSGRKEKKVEIKPLG